MHRLLLIANRTCPCPVVHDAVADRVRDHEDHQVLLVAPALTTRLAYWVSDVDSGRAEAHGRVEQALARLDERGVRAIGAIGDADPWVAINDALVDFPADEIVIATHPPGQSHWTEKRLVDRARAALDFPVHHVISEYDLDDEAAEPAIEGASSPAGGR